MYDEIEVLQLGVEWLARIMLIIIYIEVCRRLGVTIVGARVGEYFFIWPKTEYIEVCYNLI